MAKKNTNTGNKTKCPIGREVFLEKAAPLTVQIGDQTLIVDVKKFSTGSFGWYSNSKIVVKVGDVPLKVQVGLNLTVVGSKEV